MPMCTVYAVCVIYAPCIGVTHVGKGAYPCYSPAPVSERACSAANHSRIVTMMLIDACACTGQDDAAAASEKQEEPRPEKHESSTG